MPLPPRSGVERLCHRSRELASAVEKKPRAVPRFRLALERFQQPRLQLRTDAGNAPEAPLRGRLSELSGGVDVEGACDLDRPPCREAEVATESDEFR